MSRFFTGDVIVPKQSADDHYSIANTDMKRAEVLDVMEDGKIIIKVLQHSFTTYEGTVLIVSGQHYRHIEKARLCVLDEIQCILDKDIAEEQKIALIRGVLEGEEVNEGNRRGTR